MMKQAGVPGRYTNHSLRVTAATRMFSCRVDEQIIKEKTGHRSNAVWSYKRTDESLLRKAEMAAVGRGSGLSDPSDNKSENFDFDIDMLDSQKMRAETVRYKTLSDSAPDCHKKSCTMKDKHGNCPKICKILKKIDAKKHSAKRLTVSLKFKKK